jgi:hypothetical protein
MSIRKLTAQEIECRVSRCNKYSNSAQVVLLLYKDARVDQRILDEVYTPMNWKREHSLIGDRLYCTVSIWDAEKGQWISKQDVGTESNAEPEKGQASDAFKRACFNWGIGRELYTAPRIAFYIPLEKLNDRGQPKCSFDVAYIDYKNESISDLVVIDDEFKVVYDMNGYVGKRAVLHPNHERWPGMVNAISTGQMTLEKVKQSIFLPAFAEDMLLEVLSNNL